MIKTSSTSFGRRRQGFSYRFVDDVALPYFGLRAGLCDEQAVERVDMGAPGKSHRKSCTRKP